MSRSFQREPVTGVTCCVSEKWWKVENHRRHRRRTKEALLRGAEAPLAHETSNSWRAPKDGRHRYSYQEFREGVFDWKDEIIRPYSLFGK